MRRVNAQQSESSVGFLVSPDARNWKTLDSPKCIEGTR